MNLSVLHATPFYELTSILLLAAIVGYLCLALKQPMVVGFIIVGILVGPDFLGLVQSHDHIELLAELGVAVLLFLVGLKLDLHLVKTLGLVSLATGLGQVLFTSVIGFFIGIALGLDCITSVYVAVALTFSSTIIIVKLLSDKQEVDSLHGRIAIGFLIVQDLVVVLAMIVLSTFGLNNTTTWSSNLTTAVTTGLVLISFLMVFIKYIATPLINQISRSPELLITFALSFAALMATMGNLFGFSKELGGLIAGVALASTPLKDTIAARLAPLRDFLLLFFFIALGSKLNFSQLEGQVVASVVFSMFVLIGNPLIVLVIMGLMGYRKRTGFLAGLTVAQISEFSLIFMAMGVTLGHVSIESLGLVTLVGLITIALSVYMITYSQPLYQWLEPLLSFFERKTPYREQIQFNPQDSAHNIDVVIFGLGRYGKGIVERLMERNLNVLAIDFNPEAVQHWQALGHQAIYGDACDVEFISSLPLAHVRWVVCAIPYHMTGVTHQDPRVVLTKTIKHLNPAAQVAVTSHHTGEHNSLRGIGVDVILEPFSDAANRAVEILLEAKKRDQ